MPDPTDHFVAEKTMPVEIFDRLLDERDRLREDRDRADRLAESRGEAIYRLRDALERVKAQQPKTLERLQADGVVFDEHPHHDPSNWQQIAFWIYTDLCEVDSLAKTALAPDAEWDEVAQDREELRDERDRLREALVGLKLATDCWCDLGDHDYACRAAQAALAEGKDA